MIDSWPAYVEAMAQIKETILEFRASSPSMQGLAMALGSSPTRPPPSPRMVSSLRRKVAKAIGLTKKQAEKHHPASTWRYEIVKQVMDAANDPDKWVHKWLESGFPVGIKLPLEPGGLLPRIDEQASLTPEDLEDKARWSHNHQSFDTPEGTAQPAHELLLDLVDKGYAYVFKDLAAAEAWLGAPVFVSPLGDVVKQRPDGTHKHRLIMDLRASEVNATSRVQERQVLPRFVDHTRDVALLSCQNVELGVLVLDYQNAFMTLPLADEEMGFNASVMPQGLTRTRAPLLENEAETGEVLLWRVLGFGGHSNPLAYARAASFAARSAQAWLSTSSASADGCAAGRLQLYVDDPILTLAGTRHEQELSLDLVVAWWLCLGIPLSWEKGVFVDAVQPHDWIGVSFRCTSPGTCTMTIPTKFRSELLQLAECFASSSRRTATLVQAHALCGKAGRLSQVAPEARPSTTALFAALAASIRASSQHLERPPF